MSLIEQDRTAGSLSGGTGIPIASSRSRRGLLGIGFAMVGAGDHRLPIERKAEA